jgi:hypothetical protein
MANVDDVVVPVNVVSTVVSINVTGHLHGCNILMVDNDGTVYISYPDFTIQRVSPTGTVVHYLGQAGQFAGPTNYADGPFGVVRFDNPQKMVRGPDGTLYVGEMYRIRAISIRNRTVTTLAGRGDFDSKDLNIPGEIRGYKGHDHIIDGPGPAAFISMVEDIWFDSTGKLMFWDEDILRSVALDGTVTTVAYGDIEVDQAFEKHATGQVGDSSGNAYYPSKYFDAIDGAAMIKRLPDGSKQAFGQLVDEGAQAQDGPFPIATFDQVTSVGYSQGLECLYTMERHRRPVDQCSLRKITLGKPRTMQLMGEQIARQVPIEPEHMALVSRFTGSKDPQRVYKDSVKNRGVALPRGGRRTRRRKMNRKKKMTRKQRSTSSYF